MLPVCVLCATVKHLKIHLSFFLVDCHQILLVLKQNQQTDPVLLSPGIRRSPPSGPGPSVIGVESKVSSSASASATSALTPYTYATEALRRQ